MAAKRTKEDLKLAWLIQQLPVGIVDGSTEPVAGSSQLGINGDTVGGLANVIAPIAGAVIYSIASGNLPAGVYNFDITAGYASAIETTNDFNQEFRIGGVSKLRLMVFAVANRVVTVSAKFRVDGTQAASVNAILVGSGASSYVASIYATRIGN